MIKNPFSSKNIFWYKIFKPFVDVINKMQDFSDKSGINTETDKITIKKGNDIIELAENFIRVGIQHQENSTTDIGIEIDKTQRTVSIITGDNTLIFDDSSINKFWNIMSQYDAIMAL